MAHRVYSDEEAAHALAVMKANRGNAKKTAAELHIPRTTLRQWAGRAKSDTAHPKQVEPALQLEAASGLAKKWGAIAEKATEVGLAALEHLDPATLKAGEIEKVLTGGAIATDKQNLLTGQPTSRSLNISVSYLAPTALRDLSSNLIEGQFTPLPVPETAQTEAPALPETTETGRT